MYHLLSLILSLPSYPHQIHALTSSLVEGKRRDEKFLAYFCVLCCAAIHHRGKTDMKKIQCEMMLGGSIKFA